MKFAVKLFILALFFSIPCLFANNEMDLVDYKAANSGDAKAQYNLGFAYLKGSDEIRHDDKKAFEWFKKSADNGYPHAMCMVGICYAYGKGVNQDDKKALEYFRKAADKDIPEAYYNIGWFYERGKAEFKPDEEKAIEFYQKAAELEHNAAKEALNRIKQAKEQQNNANNSNMY